MEKLVKFPRKFKTIFLKAGKVVEAFFSKKQFDASNASLKIADERYVLIRASSLSIDFFECVLDLYRDKEKEEAINVTRQLLFDMSHAIGMKDASHFFKRMNLKNPLELLGTGPFHFAYTGWAFVEISSNSRLTLDENFVTYYKHLNSFEAEAWLKAGKKSDIPVCTMNAGYSSGWSEQSCGIPLVATELTCRAKDDESCFFIMAPPHKIES